MRVKIEITEASIDVVSAVLRSGDLYILERNSATNNYRIISVPLDPSVARDTLTALVDLERVRANGAETTVIPRVTARAPMIRYGNDHEAWAYCPDHPLWEPLARDPDNPARLYCTGSRCPPYETRDSEQRYANR